MILSNAESGDGFSDILIEPENPDAGIVIEVKYASSIAGLEKACTEALEQISKNGTTKDFATMAGQMC